MYEAICPFDPIRLDSNPDSIDVAKETDFPNQYVDNYSSLSSLMIDYIKINLNISGNPFIKRSIIVSTVWKSFTGYINHNITYILFNYYKLTSPIYGFRALSYMNGVYFQRQCAYTTRGRRRYLVYNIKYDPDSELIHNTILSATFEYYGKIRPILIKIPGKIDTFVDMVRATTLKKRFCVNNEINVSELSPFPENGDGDGDDPPELYSGNCVMPGHKMSKSSYRFLLHNTISKTNYCVDCCIINEIDTKQLILYKPNAKKNLDDLLTGTVRKQCETIIINGIGFNTIFIYNKSIDNIGMKKLLSDLEVDLDSIGKLYFIIV